MAQPQLAALGSIYRVPSKGYVVFIKVIYQSLIFKELVLLRVFERRFPIGVDVSEDLPTLPSRCIYTGMGTIRAKKWDQAGTEPVTDAEAQMSLRTVARDVWLGDSLLRPASDEDMKRLPKMLVYGANLVELEIGKA